MIFQTIRSRQIVVKYRECSVLANEGIVNPIAQLKLDMAGEPGSEIHKKIMENEAEYEATTVAQMNEVQAKEAECLDDAGIKYSIEDGGGSGKFNQLGQIPTNYFPYITY